MKRVAAIFVAIAATISLTAGLLVPEAQAISRYTSTSLDCGSVQAKVRNEGAVILRWTSRNTGNQLYDRFVRGSSYCDPNERAVPASVPTADRSSCSVKKCKRCEPRRDRKFFGLAFDCR